MSWLTKISDLHVKLATLFTKIEDLTDNFRGLAADLKETSFKVVRLEGMMAASGNIEMLQLLSEVNSRLIGIEMRLAQMEREHGEGIKKTANNNTP